MDPAMTVLVAIIGAAAGIAGAILGALVGARGARIVAEAERAEERRARFADRLLDLSVEMIDLVDNITRDFSRNGRTAIASEAVYRLEMRLKLLLREKSSLAALDELETAATNLTMGLPIQGGPEEMLDRADTASSAFEQAVRRELDRPA